MITTNSDISGEYTVKDGTISIASYAFYNCTSLTSVTIPDSTISIGDDAFKNCTALTNVTIGTGITSIGSEAFYYCTSLTSVTIPDSVTSIGSEAFCYCTSLTSVTIPDSVTSIGAYAFAGCTKLTSVTIPNGVENIGDEAFNGCSKLTSVIIPDGVMRIGEYVFFYCTGLTSVTIGNGVTNISNFTFYGCSNLTSVSMTKSVTDVGNYAFYETCVFFVYYEGDEDDWDYILWGTGNDTIQGATVIYNGDPSVETVIKSGTCSDDISWTLSNFGNLVISGTGDMPDYSYSSAPWYSYGNYVKSIIIEDGITGIGDYAFYYIATAKSVTIPASVTSIGSRAFYGYSAVGDLYIDDIASWMSIVFESNYSNPMQYAKNVYVDNVLTTSVEIPSGTEAIKSYVFYGYGTLTSVTIPKSVTTIENYSFTDCDAVTEVYYAGTSSEWKKVSGYSRIPSTATVYYDESDATPTPTVAPTATPTAKPIATPTTAPTTAPVYTAVPIQVSTVTQTETADTWSFEVTLETTYADSTVYAAAYDESGALFGLSITPLNTDSAAEITLKKYADADIVKIFVWNDKMQPISTVWENEVV